MGSAYFMDDANVPVMLALLPQSVLAGTHLDLHAIFINFSPSSPFHILASLVRVSSFHH